MFLDKHKHIITIIKKKIKGKQSTTERGTTSKTREKRKSCSERKKGEVNSPEQKIREHSGVVHGPKVSLRLF